jgi:hypothetical protein
MYSMFINIYIYRIANPNNTKAGIENPSNMHHHFLILLRTYPEGRRIVNPNNAKAGITYPSHMDYYFLI